LWGVGRGGGGGAGGGGGGGGAAGGGGGGGGGGGHGCGPGGGAGRRGACARPSRVSALGREGPGALVGLARALVAMEQG